jgi:hypothetical protein
MFIVGTSLQWHERHVVTMNCSLGAQHIGFTTLLEEYPV